MIKKIDTWKLENVDYDKLNNVFKNAKPLTSGDVIDIGVKKVKSDATDILNGAGDYLKTVYDYFKNLLNFPMTFFFIVLFVFVILK